VLRVYSLTSDGETPFCLGFGGGPTGLLGERGTVSPAGDLNFSGS